MFVGDATKITDTTCNTYRLCAESAAVGVESPSGGRLVCSDTLSFVAPRETLNVETLISRSVFHVASVFVCVIVWPLHESRSIHVLFCLLQRSRLGRR